MRSVKTPGFFRQTRAHELFSMRFMMPFKVQAAWLVAVIVTLTAGAFSVVGQTNYYTANGTEYAVVGNMIGEQMWPDVAISTTGGYLVWQDNATDGNGWGISAQKVDSTLTGYNSTFRVNVQGTNDQENARVGLLKNGGAVFVWQGGLKGYQHIFARYLSATNTWLTTTDLVVSAFTNNFQANPAVAVLNNSNVVVVWNSYNQYATNSMFDVYAKILSPSGATVKSEFLVNQYTSFSQRTPAVAALTNGGFVVVWVSEQQTVAAPDLGANSGTYYSASGIVVPSVDIYGRLFQTNGTAVGSEFMISTNSRAAANPAVTAMQNGGFLVAWSSRDFVQLTNGWDICSRPFSVSGTNYTAGTTALVNSHLAGNQYGPHVAAIGLECLVTWTSMGQDGSREGVYGQYVHSDGSLIGNEFRVNTTTVAQQMQPVVASDGSGQFLVVWTSYIGSPYTFDLYAQRYVNVDSVLQAMSAPFVYAPFTLSNSVYQPQLVVSWAALTGISVSNYEVYVDGTKLAATATNIWTMTATNGLTVNSTHSFQLDYVKSDGARSPLSAATSGTTWGGVNWGGIPAEWMVLYYGNDTSKWPSSTTRLSASGPTLYQVFLSGGNPLDSSTWLSNQLVKTSQGFYLTWNTQPGSLYQVQVTTNFTLWSNLGSTRFAAGTNDSLYVGGSTAGYYRVVLLR